MKKGEQETSMNETLEQQHAELIARLRRIERGEVPKPQPMTPEERDALRQRLEATVGELPAWEPDETDQVSAEEAQRHLHEQHWIARVLWEYAHAGGRNNRDAT